MFFAIYARKRVKLKNDFIMSKEKEIKIEDANANKKVDEKQTEKQEEKTKADNLSAKDNSEEKSKELDPLAKAQQEVESLKKQLLYKTAEFENYRKRTLKEKADLILNGGEKTIAAILPILDDFERAIADKSEDPKAIKEGVQMIFSKFSKALESLGVKKIETKDKDFDVDFHEAVAMVPGMGDDKKGKVIDCIQPGYTLNDKVIRHAKVAVGQ